MTDIKQLSKWNRDISRAIAALGTEQFFPALIEAVNGQVKIDYPQIWLYHKDLPPRVLYHEIPEQAIASQIDQYLEGPYREDPFYQTSMHQPRAKIYRLSRVTMGKLQQSDYYRDYYADTGTCDEAIYLSKLQRGNVINLSMMRLPQHGEFTEQEYESLYLLAEPVSELIKSHSEHDDFAVTNLIQPGIDHQIDLAFRTFGASLLSPGKRTCWNSCCAATARISRPSAWTSPWKPCAGTARASIANWMSVPRRTCSPCSSTPCPAWAKPAAKIPSVFICRPVRP